MKSLEELRKIREKAQAELQLRNSEAKIKIVVGMGTSGIAAGAREVLKTFVDEISKRGIKDVIVTQTGEKGLSSAEPIVEIVEEGKEKIIYGNIDPKKAIKIIEDHIIGGKVIKEFMV
ncbi:MAG: (2Fe-2S) ferredoxin domain-containing protein [Spirochaetes bacterium]|nr:(2Fe-2S) ferredoxin domain-containing protein [Spirochaetota bacterium]